MAGFCHMASAETALRRTALKYPLVKDRRPWRGWISRFIYCDIFTLGETRFMPCTKAQGKKQHGKKKNYPDKADKKLNDDM